MQLVTWDSDNKVKPLDGLSWAWVSDFLIHKRVVGEGATGNSDSSKPKRHAVFAFPLHASIGKDQGAVPSRYLVHVFSQKQGIVTPEFTFTLSLGRRKQKSKRRRQTKKRKALLILFFFFANEGIQILDECELLKSHLVYQLGS